VTLVIDASIAAKWVLPEHGTDLAVALRNGSDELIAPALIVAEIGNAVWKRALRNELSLEEAVSAVGIAAGLMTRLVPLEGLSTRAMEIAIQLRHPIYDCFYLALAERERAPIISADAKLLAAAKKMKGVVGRKL
jgi:predicted nucleic acid-binding protein